MMGPAAERQRSAKDLSLRVMEILNRGEFDRLDEVFDDDIVTEWPQSGERVRGLENTKAVLSARPGDRITPDPLTMEVIEGDEETFLLTPMFTMVRAEGHGDTATITLKTRYPDGTYWHIVTIMKVRDGKVVHQVQYFAQPLEAPEWRAKWVEPMEIAEGGPGQALSTEPEETK
jgi:ketosteroid isomerase-like protein